MHGRSPLQWRLSGIGQSFTGLKQGRRKGIRMVGTGRFELPTPRTPSECSTRLSHVPTAGNRSAIERLGLTSKFYTSPLCRVAEQVISISVSALLSAALVLRQSQIESSFLPDQCDQPELECAAPGDRFFGCAGR